MAERTPGDENYASYDMTLELARLTKFDETLFIETSVRFDETFNLQKFFYGSATYDMRLFIWKTAEQPSSMCVTVESPALASTIGDVVVEHPAIKKVEFYDKNDALVDSVTNLTDLKNGKIVTRISERLDMHKPLSYLKVITADGKVHTIYV